MRLVMNLGDTGMVDIVPMTITGQYHRKRRILPGIPLQLTMALSMLYSLNKGSEMNAQNLLLRNWTCWGESVSNLVFTFVRSHGHLKVQQDGMFSVSIIKHLRAVPGCFCMNILIRYMNGNCKPWFFPTCPQPTMLLLKDIPAGDMVHALIILSLKKKGYNISGSGI